MPKTKTDWESRIMQGVTYHHRRVPKQHQFSYHIYLFWLKLSEIPQLANELRYFNHNQSGLLNFRRNDYCPPTHLDLASAVKAQMAALAETDIDVSGEVFFLGNLCALGLYFSPVNFYFLRQNGSMRYLLAEVSNTPWGDRQYYLVDVQQPQFSDKLMHVSPFNPMDMQYHWTIQPDLAQFKLNIDCVRANKEFSAGISLREKPLTQANLNQVLRRIPSMTIKTMVGIYWQALVLFIKRVPLYSYPHKKVS